MSKDRKPEEATGGAWSSHNRTKSVNRQLYNNVQTGWEPILADAQAAMRRIRADRRAISQSIKVIQAKIEAGEKCPKYILARSTENTHDGRE